MENDDTLVFAPEEVAMPRDRLATPWKLVIVDDEAEVHRVTRMVLADFVFGGRGLEFLSAYSAKEAQALLREHPDAAVVLLDVVMEEEDSGLRLARFIREEMHNYFVRIVLRTGQPGHAPEEQVILQYDINDYKSKTELTATRLFTTVVASLRAYRDIRTLDQNKRGLETILKSSAQVFEFRAIEQFAQGVLTQLTSLLHLNESALYAKAAGFAAHSEGGRGTGHLQIFSGTGEYAERLQQPVDKVVSGDVLSLLQRALDEKQEFILDHDRYVGYFRSDNGSENVLYLQGCEEQLSEWDRYLLEVFCANVAIAFDNISLNNELLETQREIILKLGEIVETRSRETGNHVKRVAEYTALLAEAAGLNREEVETLRFASPMHDVGKVGIADAILNKEGPLTPDEFDVIKQHTTNGHAMLKASKRKLMQAAATIALEHHEKYNGSGYPRGLRGSDIHLYGRITAIADVFDALGVKRAYKDAWPLEKILDYFREQRGEHFDPGLVDLFFRDLDRFVAIRDAFPDVP